MCILPAAACNKERKRGLTLTETIVVLVIGAILAVMGVAAFTHRMEMKAAEDAKVFLKLLWQAEQNYFTWKNSYTQDLATLEIDDPNKIDAFYEYNVTKATTAELIVNATRRNRGKGFFINETGVIKDF